jgi:hypothetical protein
VSAERRLLVGLPFETIGQDLIRSRAIGPDRLNELAKSDLALERGVLVLVGDRKTLEQVRKIEGLPEPVEVDAWGRRK